MNDQASLNSPCPHMKRALECMAQGKRGGVYLWYARIHTLKCARCRAAYEALKAYFTHLKSTFPDSELDIERLRNGLRSADGDQ